MRTTIALAAACLSALACTGGPEADESKTPLTTPAEQTPVARGPEGIQLDSGNAAFRARNYELARKHFRAAVELKPDFAAGWFGVYMAEDRLGNKAAADSAMKRAEELGSAAAIHHPAAPDTTKN